MDYVSLIEDVNILFSLDVIVFDCIVVQILCLNYISN